MFWLLCCLQRWRWQRFRSPEQLILCKGRLDSGPGWKQQLT